MRKCHQQKINPADEQRFSSPKNTDPAIMHAIVQAEKGKIHKSNQTKSKLKSQIVSLTRALPLRLHPKRWC